MSRRVFLSDWHVSRGQSLVSGYPRQRYDWFDHEDRERLLEFCGWLHEECSPGHSGAQGPVSEVVLLGDVFDNWVYPHDERPPTLRELLSSDHARPVVSALAELGRRVSVVYVPGNHDMMLDPVTLREFLPDVVHGGSGVLAPYYVAGRLRAEHGNAYALCSAPDALRPQNLPLGYFISRLGATACRDMGAARANLTGVMQEVLGSCGHERVGEAIIDAMCEKVRVSPDTDVKMPADLWGGTPVKLRDIRAMYGRIFDERRDMFGLKDALLSIPAELGALSTVAAARFQRRAVTTVIMGHTHKPTLERCLPLGGGASIYANTGCFCRGGGHWVEVTRDGASTELRLMQWVRGAGGVPAAPKVVEGPFCCGAGQ